jgi:hypothetical protein
MSEEKKTIVGKLLQSLFGDFKSKWEKWILKIANLVPDELGDKLKVIVLLIERLKEYVHSEDAENLVKFIPGDIDNELLEWFKKILPEYPLEKYDLSYSGHAHLLAAQLTKELSGMSFGQSAVTIEAKYQKMLANHEL